MTPEERAEKIFWGYFKFKPLRGEAHYELTEKITFEIRAAVEEDRRECEMRHYHDNNRCMDMDFHNILIVRAKDEALEDVKRKYR